MLIIIHDHSDASTANRPKGTKKVHALTNLIGVKGPLPWTNNIWTKNNIIPFFNIWKTVEIMIALLSRLAKTKDSAFIKWVGFNSKVQTTIVCPCYVKYFNRHYSHHPSLVSDYVSPKLNSLPCICYIYILSLMINII